jgi:MASE9
LTILSGSVLLASCLAGESTTLHPAAFVAYCLLALLASALKVRVPGVSGTFSVSFLFVLISVAVFSFSETVLLASVACIVQCFWKARRRPRLVQVSFNVSVLAISSGLSYRVAHLFAGSKEVHLAVLLSVATCFYFTANTMLTSGVLSLIEGKSLFHIWQQSYVWTFPYYLVGAGIAALVVEAGRTMGWATAMLVLPVMYLVYVFYRLCVEKMAPVSSPAETT